MRHRQITQDLNYSLDTPFHTQLNFWSVIFVETHSKTFQTI